MTNFEKVKELLTIEDMVTNPCKVIHRLRNEDGCVGIRFCEECKQWLAEEYVEPITLPEAERVILENIDKDFRYIARERSGNLCVYKDRPTKGISTWINGIITMHMGVFSHLFQFIKWEDEQPYNIEELLEG